MTPRLDKSRPYGIITPHHRGALFEQDGNYFAGNGDFMFREGETPGARKAEAGAPAPAEPPSAPSGTTGSQEAVDLAAWVRGDKKYGFFAVKKAAKEAVPGIDTSTSETIKAGLSAAGIV